MDAFTTLNPADDAVTDATNAATGLRERLMGELAVLSAETGVRGGQDQRCCYRSIGAVEGRS